MVWLMKIYFIGMMSIRLFDILYVLSLKFNLICHPGTDRQIVVIHISSMKK
jgi:hypothetical protein